MEKIFIKFPTRERPQKAIQRIEECLSMADNPKNVTIMVSADLNDVSMQRPEVKNKISSLGALLISGYSQNKIHAINRDMEHSGEWDIGVLLSDDMVCQKKGWDSILIAEMEKHFPDTLGALWHWDGDEQTRFVKNEYGKRIKGLCTMNIFGRKYYDWRTKWYQDGFKSLWCDNQETDIMLNEDERYYYGKPRCFYSDDVLFKHDHYSNNGQQPDDLMRRTQAFYSQDQVFYNYQKMRNHGIEKV